MGQLVLYSRQILNIKYIGHAVTASESPKIAWPEYSRVEPVLPKCHMQILCLIPSFEELPI